MRRAVSSLHWAIALSVDLGEFSFQENNLFGTDRDDASPDCSAAGALSMTIAVACKEARTTEQSFGANA